MKIKAHCESGRLKISLEGELDHHAARAAVSAIEKSIDDYLPRSCTLDLSRLSFMDSSGIAVILKTYRRMNEIEGRFCVEDVQNQPLRVLDAAGIDRIINITASVKEA